MLSETLSSAGCTVRTTSNGMSALRAAAETVPDVAVLSAVLPEISTEDVLWALRSDVRTRGVAVVLVHAGEAARASAPAFELCSDPAQLLAALVAAVCTDRASARVARDNLSVAARTAAAHAPAAQRRPGRFARATV